MPVKTLPKILCIEEHMNNSWWQTSEVMFAGMIIYKNTLPFQKWIIASSAKPLVLLRQISIYFWSFFTKHSHRHNPYSEWHIIKFYFNLIKSYGNWKCVIYDCRGNILWIYVLHKIISKKYTIAVKKYK